MGNEMMRQLFINPRALNIAGGVISFLAFVPGLPTWPFLFMGVILLGVAWFIQRFQKEEIADKKKADDKIALAPKKENIENLLPLDLVELEVGYGLINIVESDQSGDLLERIASIRKQFAVDLGIIVPSVHIRDNLQLDAGEYRVLIKGNKVAGGMLRSDSLLAMDPGQVSERIDGTPTKEPAFGLDALWISPTLREQAEIAGYTVVDLPTVMATHLTEIIRTHAGESFSRQEASQLIDSFKKTNPKVVEELIPDQLSFGAVVRVLQGLLREQISIRDLRTIFESLADEATRSKDTEVLTEGVRKAMARAISSKFRQDGTEISVLSLSPHVEELISNSLLQTENGVQLVMDPHTAQKLITQIAGKIESHPEIAGQPIVLSSPTVRRHLFKLIHRFIPQVVVLSHQEISTDSRIQSVDVVEIDYAS